MYGEIVHALFALLNKRVAIYFPGEVFHLTVNFFERLIDWHCAYWNRTVADNPFACFVNVVSCRKVHKCISTPVATPNGFVHFFLD